MPRITHTQSMHRGFDGGPLNADDILVTDVGGLYAGTNIEDVLAEIAVRFGTYIHTQVGAAATWVINHNLNRFPSVSVVDSGNTTLYGEIVYDDANSITLTFTAAFSGAAYLN